MRSLQRPGHLLFLVLLVPCAAVAQTAPETAALLPDAQPHDLTPLGMYEAADAVVKAVMLSLVAAVFLCATVFVQKSYAFAVAMRDMRRSLKTLTGCDSLEAAQSAFSEHKGPVAQMLQIATSEIALAGDQVAAAGPGGSKERVHALLSRVEVHAVARMRRGTSILATTGAVAPFVGLFGTVWGIMNSFIGIAETGTTNLSVVAPGIAEALLATAIGLVAAIPAVVLYNLFSRRLAAYRILLADASASVEALTSRELDATLAAAAKAGGV